MSKIFVSNWITLDGIFSGPNGETEWFSSDEELENYNLDVLGQANTIIFGRKTFQIMEDFWPAPPAYEQYPRAAEYMNQASKHTFSQTIDRSDWKDCHFYKSITKEVIESIKANARGDIVILGSSDVAMQLHQMGLVDQYNILLDPKLGIGGKRFFHDTDQTSLELIESRPFPCGVVYLKYKVSK